MTDPWLRLCVGRPCIACGLHTDTVVPAHANEQRFGKGLGIKAGDWTVIPLCRSCHHGLDEVLSRDEARAMWRDCWLSHMSALLSAGLVAPVGPRPRETVRPRSGKVIPHPGYSR